MKINPKLRDMKINQFERLFGKMTSDEALQQAVFADDIIQQMSNHDSAKLRFIKERDSFLEFAELLENQELFPLSKIN